MFKTRQVRGLGFLALAMMGVGFAQTPVSAEAPDPNIVPESWQLKFEFRKLNIIPIRTALSVEPKLYYYLVYKVTNKTGSARIFAPDLWLRTDAGDLVLANKVPPAVFRAIKARIKNPLLEDPSKVVGKLLEGEDNARESVAIWPAPKHDVNNIRIFVGGLSGETHRMYKVTAKGDTNLEPGTFVALKKLEEANRRVKEVNDSIRSINPDATDADLKKLAEVEKLPVVLRKTLYLEYQTPGDETHTGDKPFLFKRKEWVIR